MSVLHAPARWAAPSATAVLWALAAASVVFWGLRLAAPSDSVAPPAVTAPPVTVDSAAVGRLLGAQGARVTVAATPDAATRFALLGVVAGTDGRGAALIAVDGKAPRPFRVGSKVEEGYVLQSLTTRSAALGAKADGEAAFTLQLPTRPLAANPPPTPISMAPVGAPPPLPPRPQNFAPPPVMAPPTAVPVEVPPPGAPLPPN